MKSVIKPNLNVITDFAWKHFAILVDDLTTTFDVERKIVPFQKYMHLTQTTFQDFLRACV